MSLPKAFIQHEIQGGIDNEKTACRSHFPVHGIRIRCTRFADANSDYIAAVKAYQAQIAAKEAAYVAAVDAYSKNAKAKADADSAAILKAARAAQAKADAECLAVIAAGKPHRLRLTPE